MERIWAHVYARDNLNVASEEHAVSDVGASPLHYNECIHIATTLLFQFEIHVNNPIMLFITGITHRGTAESD